MSEDGADFLDRAKARVGTTIGGKYRIDRVLGIGGMAAVFAATHRNGHRVALKLLNPDLSVRPDIRARFRREGQAANRVNHPGVVVVLDDDVADDGSAYLVMELLDGEVVESIWERNGQRLPAAFVLALARELCAVLAVAHGAGIVHRDLKPENLFLTREGKLKVLDFGLAQLRDAARPKETHTGMVFGTPAFMPPEQASGRTSQLDARTDLWALGATMFTLLSGAMVHEGETAQHFVMLAATKPARPLATVLPTVHPEIASLVDRALTFDKGLRWESAEAMRDAVRATSRLVLGDGDVPLILPIGASDPAVDEATRVGHLLAPIDDTLPEEDAKTRIERPRQIDSSAPPTQPRAKSPGAAPAGALAMTSDTPTKERALDEEPATQVRVSPIDPVTEPQRHSTKKVQAQRQDVTANLTPGAFGQQDQRQDVTAHLPVQAAKEQQTEVIQSPLHGQRRPAALRPAAVPEARGSYLPPVATPRIVPTRRDPAVTRTVRSIPKREIATILPVALAALLVIAAPICFFVIRGRGASGAVKSPTLGPNITSAAMTASASVASPAPISTPTAAETTLTSRAPAVPITPPPQVPTLPPQVPTLPPQVPMTPRSVLISASTMPPASRPALAPSSRCAQPFDLDDAGIKHWKTECLQDTRQ